MRATATIITLILLLAALTGPALAQHASPSPSWDNSAPTDEPERTGESPLICLALVAGVALLAGGVWTSTMRRMAA
jgi:hypothetical protein